MNFSQILLCEFAIGSNCESEGVLKIAKRKRSEVESIFRNRANSHCEFGALVKWHNWRLHCFRLSSTIPCMPGRSISGSKRPKPPTERINQVHVNLFVPLFFFRIIINSWKKCLEILATKVNTINCFFNYDLTKWFFFSKLCQVKVMVVVLLTEISKWLS